MTEQEWERFYGQYRQSLAQALHNPALQSGAGPMFSLYTGLAQCQAYPCQAIGQTFPAPRAIEDAGISAGEIIGHRAWILRSGLLHSMVAAAVWSPDEPMYGNVEDGSTRYGGGVHAFKTQGQVLQEYEGCGPLAIGTVALWGTVIQHEYGYRAEWGRVSSLDMIHGVGKWREYRLLKQLRRRYLGPSPPVGEQLDLL